MSSSFVTALLFPFCFQWASVGVLPRIFPGLPSLRDGSLPLEPRAASRLRGTHRPSAMSTPATSCRVLPLQIPQPLFPASSTLPSVRISVSSHGPRHVLSATSSPASHNSSLSPPRLLSVITLPCSISALTFQNVQHARILIMHLLSVIYL